MAKMKSIRKAMVAAGTYKDQNSGQEKTSYRRIGSLLKSDDGEVSVVLDDLLANIVGFKFINFWELDKADGNTASTQGSRGRQQDRGHQDEFDDDIPF